MHMGGRIEQLGMAMVLKYPLEMVLSMRASALVATGRRSPLQLWIMSYRGLLVVAALLPSVLLFVQHTAPQQKQQHEKREGGASITGAPGLPFWCVVAFAVPMAGFHSLNKAFFTAQGLYFNSISASVSASSSASCKKEAVAELECGGTVVTLLNTLANIGRFIPITLIAWLADIVPGGFYTVKRRARHCHISSLDTWLRWRMPSLFWESCWISHSEDGWASWREVRRRGRARVRGY